MSLTSTVTARPRAETGLRTIVVEIAAVTVEDVAAEADADAVVVGVGAAARAVAGTEAMAATAGEGTMNFFATDLG